MRISPKNDCKWDYRATRLSVFLPSDDGMSYIFETHYDMRELLECPRRGTSFCIQDATLLTAYLEGLSRIKLSDSDCLDLGLNALACERFVRPSIPCSRYFFRRNGGRFNFHCGDVVSLYSRSGAIADCIVLEELDADSVTRLMLLNPSFDFAANESRKCKLGNMIRVNSECVCGFREYDGKLAVKYA